MPKFNPTKNLFRLVSGPHQIFAFCKSDPSGFPNSGRDHNCNASSKKSVISQLIGGGVEAKP